MILLMLAAQAAAQNTVQNTVQNTGAPAAARYDHCLSLAVSDPASGAAEAVRWRAAGGGYLARQCAGVAEAGRQNWTAAATEFEASARDAETAHDVRSASFWALAGNARLADGDAEKARTDLDAALSSGDLAGLARGEAQLDRARALVATGDSGAARTDLDAALVTAAADPLAWLLSATLARRMHDLPRANKDIAEALRRSADDASVQLEAGNIAASAGDEAGARRAWSEAARIAPDAATGKSAAAALRQFDEPATQTVPASTAPKAVVPAKAGASR